MLRQSATAVRPKMLRAQIELLVERCRARQVTGAKHVKEFADPVLFADGNQLNRVCGETAQARGLSR